MANNRRGQIDIPLMIIPPEEDIVLKEEEESEDESDVDDEVPIENDFIFGTDTTEKPIQNDPLELPIQKGRFKDKTQFTMEMQKEVGQMIQECVKVLNKDPREYHQFYVTVQKWVELGFKHNHISNDKVPLIWEKSDSFASSEFKRYHKNPIIFEKSLDQPQPAECSKHPGEHQKASNLRSVSRVETHWKRIFSSTTSFKYPLSCIKTRLLFFHYAKALTSPKECLEMNSLWNRLLSSQLVEDVQPPLTSADVPRSEDNLPNADVVMVKDISKMVLKKSTPTNKEQRRQANRERMRRLRQKMTPEQKHAEYKKGRLRNQTKEDQILNGNSSGSLSVNQHLQKKTREQKREANRDRVRLYRQNMTPEQKHAENNKRRLRNLTKEDQILNENSPGSLSVNQHRRNQTLEQKLEAQRESARRYRQNLTPEQKEAVAEKRRLRMQTNEKQREAARERSRRYRAKLAASNAIPGAVQKHQKLTPEQNQQASIEGMRRQRQNMTPEQKQAVTAKRRLRIQTNKEKIPSTKRQKRTPEQKREAARENSRRSRAKLAAAKAEMGKKGKALILLTKKERERLQLSSDDELLSEAESKINSEECPVRENAVFESKSEFVDEMEKVMSITIQESVQVLEKDPREYHPFYVKLHLFIQAGLEQNFIDAEEVHSIWEKWDSIGASQFLKKLDVEEKMSVEEFEKIHGPSSHLSLILFKQISPSAPKRSWKIADREAQYQTVIQGWRDILSIETSSNDIRSNLALRLKLFQSCASMTFFEDFSRMTKYWGKLFNGELDHLEEKIKMRLSELQKMAEEKEEKKKNESWARYMKRQAWEASFTKEEKQEVAQRNKMKYASLTPEERKERVKKSLDFYKRQCQKMEVLKKKNFKLWEKTVNEKRIRHQELRVKRRTGREMTLEEKEQWLEMRKMNKLTYPYGPKKPKKHKEVKKIPKERKEGLTNWQRHLARMERLKNEDVKKWEEAKKLRQLKISLYDRKKLLSMTVEKRQRRLANLKIAAKKKSLRKQVANGKLTEEQLELELEVAKRKIEEETFSKPPPPPRKWRQKTSKKLEDGITFINMVKKKKNLEAERNKKALKSLRTSETIMNSVEMETLIKRTEPSKVITLLAKSSVAKGHVETEENTKELENRYENYLPWTPLLIPAVEDERRARMGEVGESLMSSKLMPIDEDTSALIESSPISPEDFENINAPYEEDGGDFDNHTHSPEVEEKIVETEVKVDEGKMQDEYVIIESFLVKPGSTVKSNLVSTDDNSKSVGESPSSPVDEKGDDSDENDTTVNSDPAWEPNLDNPESSSSSDDKSDDDNEDASTQDSDPVLKPQRDLPKPKIPQEDDVQPKKKTKQPKSPCPKCGILINTVNLLMHYENCETALRRVCQYSGLSKSSDTLICPHPQCSKIFSHTSNLFRHQRTVHGDGAKPENQLRCHLCFKSFKQKATLDAHIRRVHEGKGFYCELCPNRGDLQSAAKLWKHKVSFHELTDLAPPSNIKVVQCEFCGETVLGRYFSHVNKHHREMVSKMGMNYFQTESNHKSLAGFKDQCPECLKMFHINSLKKHRKKQHGIGIGETFVCPQCYQEFLDKHQLKKHIEIKHDNILDKLRECNLLKMYREGKWTKWKCRLCSEMEIPVSYVRTQAHFITSHNEVYEFFKNGADEKKMLKCFQCQEDFEGGAGLAEHYKEKHKLEEGNSIASKANTKRVEESKIQKPEREKVDALNINKLTYLHDSKKPEEKKKSGLTKWQRYLDKMEKLKNEDVKKWEEAKKLRQLKISLYDRKKLLSMTVEKRQRRLANLKIAGKTKTLKKLVASGELTEEQLELELEEAKRKIEEETFSKPPPPPRKLRPATSKKLKDGEILISMVKKKKMFEVERKKEARMNFVEKETQLKKTKPSRVITLSATKEKVKQNRSESSKPAAKKHDTANDSFSTKDAAPVRKSLRKRTKRKVYYDESDSSDSEDDDIDSDCMTDEVIVKVERDSFMEYEMKILKVSLVRLTEEEIEQYRVKH